ncbi:MAG: hypothetical protein EU532_07565 [Promethearchaeota archaeon]|nr:MAG: hypothetical protein EU532_07565 [Candidatus Lokiarchaeota archaeon]
MPNCYICNKNAELFCLKCGQDVCKSHYQMGMCVNCYQKRLKAVQRLITIIIIASLIGILVIIFSVLFL